MLVELVQIKFNYDSNYTLSTIYVNPLHIVSLSEDSRMKRALSEGKMNLEIHESATFTRLTLNESRAFSEMVVVGDPREIHEKIYNSKKRILLKD